MPYPLASINPQAISGALGGGAVAGPITLINDAFTDANGTQLSSHTIAPTNIPVTAWSALSQFTIQSNKAHYATTGFIYFENCNCGQSDITLSAKITLNTTLASAGGGIVVRYFDDNNFWIVYIDGNTQHIIIYKMQSGSLANMASVALPLTAGVEYTLNVVCSGASITGSIGAYQIQYASATFNQTSTKVGISGYAAGGASVDFDDFKVICSLLTQPYYNTVTTTIGGQAATLLVPKTYSGAPTTLVIYAHGVGETSATAFTEAVKKPVLDAITKAGFIVATSTAHGDNWGNQAAQDDYTALHTYVLANYNINRTLIYSQSMGGCAGLLLCAAAPFVIKGWAGIYPVCSLSNMFGGNAGTYAASIRTAFGIASDGSDYATKTAGYDPVLKAGSAFAGLRMRFYASASDTVANKAANSDAMATLVNGQATENTVVVCTGNHGDYSHFQPVDLMAFFARCV